MRHVREFAATAIVILAGVILGAWHAPANAEAENASVDEMSCAFEIQARNTGAHDVYLDLYTSAVWAGSARALKMQNARVGPKMILPPQRVTVRHRCGRYRWWSIYWRPSRYGARRLKHFETDRGTRVSSSSGRRVLVLGDVGKW